jgi:L-lactate permease
LCRGRVPGHKGRIVRTGKFEIVRHNIAALASDRRIQPLMIAFSFGAFIEGAAGFGTPLITLATVTGLPLKDLSAMVGRQLPFFFVIVPFWLVAAMCGFRRTRRVRPARATRRHPRPLPRGWPFAALVALCRAGGPLPRESRLAASVAPIGLKSGDSIVRAAKLHVRGKGRPPTRQRATSAAKRETRGRAPLPARQSRATHAAKVRSEHPRGNGPGGRRRTSGQRGRRGGGT